jgi:hypothetical protein
MIQLLTIALKDEILERVRRNFVEAIAELQRLPFSLARVLMDRRLADGVVTPIAHGLGRVPLLVLTSPVRGAASSGRLEEVRDGSFDRTKYIALKATGYGNAVSLDVVVL